MLHPLQQSIRALRCRIRRLAALHALGWMASAVLGAALILGLADYVFHFEDPGLRLTASLAVLAVFCWTAYGLLYRGLSVRLEEVSLAQRLERQFPQLRGSLASAVQFLRQSEDDATAGSAALRRAVVRQTAADAEGLDFRTALRLRPVWWAAAAAGASVLAAGVLVVLDPSGSRTALARLVEPLGDRAWPQVHHLEIRKPAPRRVDRGGTFRVAVVDAPGVRLPPEVLVFYQFENPDGPVVEKNRMDLVGGMMVAQRENVTRPFSYWVEGGDDTAMRFCPVKVELVDRPAVKSLAIRVMPPSYTGWPPEQTDRNVRALVGTRLEISGEATCPLASVVLCLEGGIQVPGRPTDKAGSFRVPADTGKELVVEKSGAYWLRLTDAEGLTGDERPYGQIHAVPDSPPTVSIDDPAANVFVTSRATLPIRVTARDDLAIERIGLVLENESGPIPNGQRTLFRGEAAGVRPPATGPTRPGSETRLPPAAPRAPPPSASAGDQRTIVFTWDIEALHLKPGTQLALSATARDRRPQTSKSPSRRLTVITPEEMNEQIAARQSAALAELTRALALQRQVRQQVAASDILLQEKLRPDQSDAGSLANAERNQRQVHRLLTSRTEGVLMHVLGLLADLENNKIDNPDVKRWMQTLLARIGRLGRSELPAIDMELTAAIKAAEIHLESVGGDNSVGWDKRSAVPAKAGRDSVGGTAPRSSHPASDDGWRPTPAADVRKSLLLASKQQDAVIQSLEQLRAELARADRFHSLYRDMEQLLRDQVDLAQRCADLSQRTLGQELHALPAESVAELRLAAYQERNLARRLQDVQREMDRGTGQLPDSDSGSAGMPSSTGILPVEAGALTDAVARARELDPVGKMQAVAERLERNEISGATERQQRIVDHLREILDILGHRRREQVESASAETAQLRESVEGLRGRQERALQESRRLEAARKPKAARDAARPPAAEAEPALPPGEQPALEDLANEQALLKTETASFAAKLGGTEGARAALDSAGGQMALAAAMLDRGQTGRATQETQQSALARLAESLAALSRPARTPSGAAAPHESVAGKGPSPQAAEKASAKAGAEAGKPGSQPGMVAAPGDSGEGPGDLAAVLKRQVDRVWGSLPQRQREQISQLPGAEEFLPKYEVLLEEYFKRLAEQQKDHGAD